MKKNKLTSIQQALLSDLNNKKERAFYTQECLNKHWSTPVLQKKIKTKYYEQVLIFQKLEKAGKTPGREKKSVLDGTLFLW